jgi:hypothetical protein
MLHVAPRRSEMSQTIGQVAEATGIAARTIRFPKRYAYAEGFDHVVLR